MAGRKTMLVSDGVTRRRARFTPHPELRRRFVDIGGVEALILEGPPVLLAEEVLAHPDDPLPDAPSKGDMRQEHNITDAFQMLESRLRNEDKVLITGRAYVCATTKPPGDTRMVRPDCLVAFGTTREECLPRNGYVVSDVGHPPNFVLETASVLTDPAAMELKLSVLMDLRVPEVFRFGRANGMDQDAPLAGSRLMDSEYAPIPTFSCPEFVDDDALHIHSEVLSLDICWRNRRLRFYDPAASMHLPNIAETMRAWKKAEAKTRQIREELERTYQGGNHGT